MLDYFFGLLFLIFWISPLLAFKLPWQNLWQLFFLSWLLFGTILVFSAGSSDDGIEFGIATMTVIMHVIAVLSIKGLKSALTYSGIKKINQKKDFFPHWQNLDSIAFGYAGFLVGMALFRFWAFDLAGTVNGLSVHLTLGGVFTGLLGLAFIATRFFTRVYRPLKFMVLSFLATLSLASFAGIFYPYVIIKSAENIAGEKPYCLLSISPRKLVMSHEDLMFLTMSKSDYTFHLYLMVESEDGYLVPYYWSFSKGRFFAKFVYNPEKYNRNDYCKPTVNFAENLFLTVQ